MTTTGILLNNFHFRVYGEDLSNKIIYEGTTKTDIKVNW
jgi:hypothetical protein